MQSFSFKAFITTALFLWFMFLTPDLAFGQNWRTERLFERAMDAYRGRDYAEAQKNLLKLIARDSLQIETYLLLADVSDALRDPAQRLFALEKVIGLSPNGYPMAYKLLGDIYYAQSDIDQSYLAYKKYFSFIAVKDSVYVATRLKQVELIREAMKHAHDVALFPLGDDVNTSAHEYWPSIMADDSVLFFTRLLRHPSGMAYERLFQSEKKGDKWLTPVELNITSNEWANEGTMCISADGKWLFYTICGQRDGFGSCDIYYSFKQNGQWLAPQNIGAPVNTKAWEAQPSLSANGQYLYFSSTREGGFGGMDIWRSRIHLLPNGRIRLGETINLGNKINSPKNDFSPFIHADGVTLYFASEGHPGFGGSDMFVARLANGSWSVPQNLGYPLNSTQNDDGLVVSPTSTTVIFSSDRFGTVGGSKDLFQCVLPDEFLPQKAGYMKGYVVDARTNTPLDATIMLSELGGSVQQAVASDREDGYLMALKAKQTYALNISLPGYLFHSEYIDINKTGTVEQAVVKDIVLSPIDTVGVVVLNNIFFDFNDFRIKPESKSELDKLIEFMNENPTIVFEIVGHTDNVGERFYNISLSEQRANAIVNYLSGSISSERMSYKGFGPDKPVASNETEDGRALNRRVEFKVVSF